MTITFPREIPSELKIVGMSFMLEPTIELAPLRSGKIISKDLGPSLWKAKYESPPLDETSFGIVRAWYASLLSTNEFYGYDFLREFPLAYVNGWDVSPFDGTCRLAGVPSASRITLTDLPVGFILTVGDFIAFDYGPTSSPTVDESRALHIVTEGGVASGSPSDVTLSVSPHIRDDWQVGETVHLFRAAAKMVILPGTYQETIDVERMGKISFEAIQTL